MRSKYYEYLKGLNKDSLIRLLYTPRKPHKDIPFKSYRKVALRVSYDGTLFKGVQNHRMVRSIGGELENSLALSGIGDSPSFCGRTDAGVSALAMVVSIRAKSLYEFPNRTYSACEGDKREYPYDSILNETLPAGIEVTGWAPVPDDFDARYSCLQRHYRYFFVSDGLDLQKMEEAAQRIKAMDNFYYLSTHSNPKARYSRKIDELVIRSAEEVPAGDRKCIGEKLSSDIEGKESFFGSTRAEDGLFYVDIRARSFLHNMVRKIVWLMKSCGQGNEFDLGYVGIADAYPLVFVGALFEKPLAFTKNKYSVIKFERAEREARILCAIATLRLHHYTEEEEQVKRDDDD